MSLQIKLNTNFSNNQLPTLWMPSAIGSDIRLWFKADTGATVDASSRLTSLADQSSHSNTLTPVANTSVAFGTRVTGVDQIAPLYVANTQNGLPGFHNDGAPGFQRFVQTTANPFAAAVTHQTPFSVAIAFRRGSASFSTDALMHQLQHDTAGTYFWDGWGIFLGPYYGGGKVGFFMGNNFAFSSASQIWVQGSTTLNAGQNYVLILNYSGSGAASGVSIYINGVQETAVILDDSLVTGTKPPQSQFPAIGSATTTNGGTVLTTAPLSIGDSWSPSSSNGETYFETIVFDRVLTPLESGMTSTYLNQRWAIY